MTSDSAFRNDPHPSFTNGPTNHSANTPGGVTVTTLHQYAQNIISPRFVESHSGESAATTAPEPPPVALPVVRGPRHAARTMPDAPNSRLSDTGRVAEPQAPAPLPPSDSEAHDHVPPLPDPDPSSWQCDNEGEQWYSIELPLDGEGWEEELLARSSLSDPELGDIWDNVSEAEVTDVMRLLHFKEASEKYPLPDDPAEGSLEEWAISHTDYPETVMKAGHSYARQGFLYRAELCFKVAYIGGHPDAESYLNMLPRDADSSVIIAPSQDQSHEKEEVTPINEEVVALVERGVKMAKSGRHGQARLLLSLGLAIDGGL